MKCQRCELEFHILDLSYGLCAQCLNNGMFYSMLLWDSIRGCNKCHTCGSILSYNLVCPICGVHRRYSCHGYLGDDHDCTPCPPSKSNK